MFRAVATTSFRRLSYHARTSLNPASYVLVPPEGYKSLLVFCTPSNLPTVIEESLKLHQASNHQIVVAGVDSLAPNSHRNGVAELWMKDYANISGSVQVDERDDFKDAPRESDGVNIVVARKNWKTIESNLRLALGATTTVNLTLANTVFSTGNLVTMFYLQPAGGDTATVGETANAGHALCDLTVTLPLAGQAVETSDRLTPLYGHEEFRVTESIGNLVKKVDNQPASGFLENNHKLMSIGSKDTEVYVKLYRASEPHKPYKYQVIAGGGGWGAKASILALSPEAKVAVGDRIEFYMLTPHDRWEPADVGITAEHVRHKLTFETSFEQRQYQASSGDHAVLEGVFGAGSEEGFTINGAGYRSAGERAVVTVG